MISGKEKSFKVFEDDKVIAVLHNEPAGQGHLLLFGKEHSPIIETIHDSLLGHMFNVANKLSTVVFEKMNAQGTNILINNGVAAGQELNHFTINVIPRWQNDGLNFDWMPKKQSDDEMSTAALLLNENTKDITVEKEKKTEVIEERAPEKIEQVKKTDEKGVENYLIRQLDRLP